MSNTRAKYLSLKEKIERGSFDNQDLYTDIFVANLDPVEIEQLYLAAINKNASFFLSIPKTELTHNVCMAIVTISVGFKKFIPDEQLNDYDILYVIAGGENKGLKFVPEAMRDFKMCLRAVKSNDVRQYLYGDNWRALEFIPEPLLMHKEFSNAISRFEEEIKKNWQRIEKFPLSLRNFDICMHAVNQNWQAIHSVPPSLLQRVEFKEAILNWQAEIRHDWRMLKTTPPEILTTEICIAAIKQNFLAIEYIPKEAQDFNFYMEAIKLYPAELLPWLENYKIKTSLNAEQFKMVCAEIAKKHPSVLKFLLFQAIEEGNDQEVKNIIEIDATLVNNQSKVIDLENKFDENMTYSLQYPFPLHAAIFYSSQKDHSENREHIVKLLLENNADPNAKANLGDTVLHCAASMGKVSFLELLIEHGAEIEEKDEGGHLTAFHYAAIFGQLDNMAELKRLGADINAKSETDANAFHLIAGFENREIIAKKLIDFGIDYDDRDCDHETPFDISSGAGLAMAQRLIDYAQLRKDFFKAIEQGNTEKVREILIKDKAIIEATSSGMFFYGKHAFIQFYPLHMAAVYGHDEIIDLLLSVSTNINEQDMLGNTALSYAAAFGHQSIFEKLIKVGADINIKYNGMTLLFAAANDKGTPEMIAQLIKAGMNINETDEEGRTPLHCAAQDGNLEAAKKLIELGAKTNIKDRYGRTPFDRAASKGYPALMKLLQPKVMAAAEMHSEKEKPHTLFAEKIDKKQPVYRLMEEGRYLMKSFQYEEANKRFREALNAINPNLNSQTHLKTILQQYIDKSSQLAQKSSYPYQHQSGSPLDVAAILMDRVRFDDKVISPKEMYDFLQKMVADPILKVILEYVALDFMINEKAHIRIVQNCNKSSGKLGSVVYGFYNKYSGIVARGTSLDQETQGTIMHEIAHYFFNKVYRNNSNPYYENDLTHAHLFNEKMKQVLINYYQFYDASVDISRLTQMNSWAIGTELAEKFQTLESGSILKEILNIYKYYTEMEEAKEFVVRLPQVIASEYTPTEMVLLEPLLEYYQHYLLPECSNSKLILTELINDRHNPHWLDL
ncbi:MAG: ankyrin repeat domain-containing protein [Gammaproteobacteria bacterium]|nr:ankyrin repeat domain-containing protein [Gammaproteobacteria bacterium]